MAAPPRGIPILLGFDGKEISGRSTDTEKIDDRLIVLSVAVLYVVLVLCGLQGKCPVCEGVAFTSLEFDGTSVRWVLTKVSVRERLQPLE